MLLDLAKLFCQITSIRGVGKIFKAPNTYLRGLWLLYVLLMVFALIFSTTNIFIDYLEYNTVIQTSWALNDTSDFPAVTFCSHHPFSGKAKAYWANGTVMSPTNWNKILRKRIRECINTTEIKKKNMMCGVNSFLDDSKRMYYQNLSPHESDLIGHQGSDILLFCVTHTNSYMLVGNPKDCGIRVQKISIPKYFNCFTVQPSVYGNRTKRVILVLNVKDKPNFENYEQAFLTDIFEQAHGVRMVIHEPNTFPDVVARGDQVEPGKLVEVSYQPINVQEMKTPKKPCFESPAEQPTITDLGISYNYSFESCISMKTGEEYFARCGCYYVDFLRPGIPNETHPYCGETLISREAQKALDKRRKCLIKIDREAPAIRKQLEETECLRRCNYYRYRVRTSITKWRPTHWQVYWIRQQLSALYLLYNHTEMLEKEGFSPYKGAQIEAAKKEIYKYTDAENLTQINGVTSGGDNPAFIFAPNKADDYVYIVISRQDSPVMVETNKLTLEFNGLVSRIGGLCSLYLGLTCAFGVELIEYIFLIKQRYSGQPVDDEEKEAKETNNKYNERERYNQHFEHEQDRRNSPVFCSTNRRGFNDYGFRDTTYRSEDESPWSPRIPLNATSL